MKIDEILTESSRKLFGKLDDEDIRILYILARQGWLNQKEIGEKTERYAISFDRWGVKKRFNGTIHFLGLIPNHYVFEHKKNNKEKLYGITFKGLLAVLSVLRFEEIYLVKRFAQLLHHLDDRQNLTSWALEFIKYEMGLILYHNNIKGLDWTRYKVLRQYWDNFKSYNVNTIQNLFLDVPFMNKGELEVYDILKREYLTLFFILDKCTSTIEWNSENTDQVNEKFLGFRSFVDKWYKYIDAYSLTDYSAIQDIHRSDQSGYYDEEFWFQERKEPQKRANRIFKDARI